ncbi:MAG: hypothetical protein PVH45_05485, partial [Candidatus Omnitrophota bacterium]
DRIVPKMRDDVESDSPRKKARKAGASKTKGPVAGRRTPGVYSATAKGESGEGMQQDEKLILETGEILRRCHLFTGNLLQVMEEQPDKPFILAFDTDLGSRQKAQFMPIHKVIDEIEKWKEKKDEKGKLMFPQLKNLEVVRASGTNTGPRGLLQRIEEMRAGKPETNIVVVTKQDNIENFDSLKGVAWIAGIYDDTTDNPYYYLPVFEAATMAIMAALDAGNIQGIKKLWDEISEEEISEDALVKMMEDRIFYVLPKMRPVRPDILRKTYEKVLEVYQAA